MADMKLADLTAGTADGTDIVYAVKDPSGTPLDRKLTLSTVKDYVTGAANLFTTAQTISPLTDVQGLTVRGGPAGTVNILQLQDSANNLLVAFDKDGLLTLGRGSGLTGQLKFSNSTNNNLVTLQAGTTSGNITFTLPTADGTSGQVLQTNGSGVLSWKTDATTSPAGSDTQLQFNNSGSFGADSTLTFNSTSKLLTAQKFSLSGNISSAAWTTSGIRYSNSSATITDTSSSGTVATAYTNVYGGNTIAASNSTTFTNYYNTFIAAPVSGTNVTFTNAWALGLGGAAQIAAGTLNGTVLDISQSWSGTGTYTGIKYNVSSDAGPANAASNLLDLQIGGSSQFKVSKTGEIFSQGLSVAKYINSSRLDLANNITTGFVYPQGTTIDIGANDSNATVQIGYIGRGKLNTAQITFGQNDGTNKDTILTRRNPANLRLGAADAAAPVAQTLSVQSVVAGTTDTAGANFTITGSQSTGTGTAGNILFQTASSAASTGTAQNALATVMTVGPNTLTGSQSTSLLDLAQTWNTTGTPTAIKLNVTDTASNASSRLLDLQVGGSSLAIISKAGGLSLGGSAFSPPTGYIYLFSGSSLRTFLAPTGITIPSTGNLNFASGVDTALNGIDVIISRKGTANLRLGATDTAASSQTYTADSTTDELTAGAAHGLMTGAAITFSNSGGALPTGISAATVYYAVVTSTTKIKIATSYANATASSPTVVDITANGSGTTTGLASSTQQSLGVQSFTGTNVSGSPLVINSSQGTGTGAGGDIIFATAAAGSSGSTQNALVPKWQITSSGVLLASVDNTYDIGAAGGRPRNLVLAGSITMAGTVNSSLDLYAGTARYMGFTNRAAWQSPSDGILCISNWNLNDFNRLQFGGTTSSFPALKRSSTTLQVRLADDSGYTTIDAQHRLQGTAPASATATGTAGDIRYDGSYIYVCTATDTWVRAALSTW